MPQPCRWIFSLAVLAAASMLSGCGGGAYHHPVYPADARQAHDSATATRVRQALAADVRIGAESLTVTVGDGVVSLGGTPRDLRARDLALQTASRVPGVRRVVNNMVFN
jgi:hypothetical protein